MSLIFQEGAPWAPLPVAKPKKWYYTDQCTVHEKQQKMGTLQISHLSCLYNYKLLES